MLSHTDHTWQAPPLYVYLYVPVTQTVHKNPSHILHFSLNCHTCLFWWISSADLCMVLLVHTSQTWLSCVSTFLCTLSSYNHLKFLWHISHWNGCSLLCPTAWLFRIVCEENILPHVSQTTLPFISSSFTLTLPWLVRSCFNNNFVANLLLHIPHIISSSFFPHHYQLHLTPHTCTHILVCKGIQANNLMRILHHNSYIQLWQQMFSWKCCASTSILPFQNTQHTLFFWQTIQFQTSSNILSPCERF